MAPDIEELINKVNTLTLDKNRLKQKLKHLTQQSSSQTGLRDTSGLLSQSSGNNHLQNQSSSDSCSDTCINRPITVANNKNSFASNNSINKPSSGDSFHANTNNGNGSPKINANVIAGVDCATSCEEDLLYMNNLYKKRIDEYNQNWDYIQSKCTALLSELGALQNHYALLKREKLDLEEKLKLKDVEYDTIKGELQTVVLNYETQLSAMSEHLSMITSQVGLNDDDLSSRAHAAN